MKKQFNLQDWLKDKSQKVETRDGRPVRIVCYDRKYGFPIMALATEADGHESYVNCYFDGRFSRADEYPSDLFIVAPEPELSEFEEALKDCVNARNPENPMTDEGARNNATILLAIARKELEPEIKAEALKEIEQDPESSYAFNRGVEYGKEEALKDLPRWRKWETGAGGNGRGIPIAIVKRGLNGYELVDALGIQGEQYIMLSDLEKLTGFND